MSENFLRGIKLIHCPSPDRLTLVLGGARSGKSRHAERLATALPAPWTYVATAQPLDDEMRARIAAHRARRETGWITVEAPINLAEAIGGVASGPVLVDCLTLWVSNLLLNDIDVAEAAAGLDAALDARLAPTILVANEVGLGIVPDNALARAFRDAAGLLNQRLAARADRVVFLVAGLPMRVK
ncbi:MAG: bifunctional adenosylcobinamide kinase/adenosylcobinamide-phosphate guanylyltransferase [Acetobacteraceae bacterium]|nr:bifunctional adenosylcobinamide kinase/adenosylcobinamide-phosphate guanylyltransferase [Acetobacteraceae bacterium]